MLVVAEVRVTGENVVVTTAVEELRDRADALSGGTPLKAAVTGPAGYTSDTVEVFGQINSTLLLATGGLVFVLLVLIYRSPAFGSFP